MCAINGVFRWDAIKQEDVIRVEASLKSMSYRGPNFSATKSDTNSILGHNRLSILDLNARSNQPMLGDNGRFVIVFNGEIYNHLNLKKELEQKGVVFKTTSDTEVLLQLYIVFGKQMLYKLRGMFAFVIWDTLNKKAFAARDRFGEKPFYFFYNSQKLFGFASNLRGITLLYENDLVINKQAIYELLSHQYIDYKTCIYKGIEKLAPGSYMEISETDIQTKTYWSPNYKNKIDVSFKDAKIKVETLLNSAIDEQLVADVPVGLFLSGGVDSSIITALASNKKSDITALTMSTPLSKTSDESKEAAYVAKKLGVNHRIIPLDENCVSFLPDALQTMEPLADASLIPSLSITKEAKKDFKVMLSGDGGDELFGGYKIPLHFKEFEFKGNMITSSLINGIIKSSDRFSYAYKKLNTKRIFKWGGIEAFYNNKSIPNKLTCRLLKTSSNFKNLSLNAFLEAKNNGVQDEDLILNTGIKTSLVNDFLFKMDSAAMFNSIETRAPFLDYRIIDFTSQLTIDKLMPNKIDKELLKSIGMKYLPREFFNLPKKGFSIPYYEYLEKSWGDVLIRLIQEGTSDDMGLIDSKEVQLLLMNYRKQPSFKLGKILYSILVFEIWLRVFHLKQDPKTIKLNHA